MPSCLQHAEALQSSPAHAQFDDEATACGMAGAGVDVLMDRMVDGATMDVFVSTMLRVVVTLVAGRAGVGLVVIGLVVIVVVTLVAGSADVGLVVIVTLSRLQVSYPVL